MPSSSRRPRRMASAVLGAVMAAFLVAGCGTGQSAAGNFDELKDNFIKGCEARLADDAEDPEAAEVPDDFCRCAFDALREGDDAVDFDELMEINDELVEEPAALPDNVTAAFAGCTSPG